MVGIIGHLNDGLTQLNYSLIRSEPSMFRYDVSSTSTLDTGAPAFREGVGPSGGERPMIVLLADAVLFIAEKLDDLGNWLITVHNRATRYRESRGRNRDHVE
jgi:hypothetical protein